MFSSLRLRELGLTGTALLVACQFDTAPIKAATATTGIVGAPSDHGTGGSQSVIDAGRARDSGVNRVGAAGTASLDAGRPTTGAKLDASATGPVQPKSGVDAGRSPPPLPDAGMSGPPPDAGSQIPDTGSGQTNPLPALQPGGLFASCTSDLSCQDGRPCYNNGPGYCAEPCQKDSDCTDYEGVDFTCYLPQGACRVDCSTSGTNGRCPSNLMCAVDSTNQTRCLLPRETGTGDKQLFEPCDIAHGSGDCVSGLTCYRAPLTQVDGPGYCTHPCPFTSMGTGMGNNCPTGGMQPAFECTVGACALICGDKDPCMQGMACEDINQQGYCHYPASM